MLSRKRCKHRQENFTQLAVFVFVRRADSCRQPQEIAQALRRSNLDGRQKRERDPHITSGGKNFEVGTYAWITVGQIVERFAVNADRQLAEPGGILGHRILLFAEKIVAST